ncbi:hypothetical protein B195_013225 [Pseudomonas sp. Lz4W]|uniref:DUF1615 domain-containing protein n=1 Tax=Pseudomonas sp. Lz4W TaxID=1206777 RepID=UPI000346843F|nr:DUF1615 domain-containing protein [Pseudomonas sp. Lz4W]AUB75754.1 hypothetical protein B195_013225 [Pseudomonas sp. Lz4W]
MNRVFLQYLLLAPLAVLAGCSSQGTQSLPDRSPEQVRARVVQLLPASIADRQGWATDIQAAFAAQGLAASDENLCSVLAVAEQESNFQADPPVPGLAKIARTEINRRASKLHIPEFVVRSALNISSANGKTYNQRLDAARTEGQLSAIFDDFIGMVPLGKSLFGNLNPVHTGGPMQVSIAFAQKQARDYPYPVAGSIRQEVFTRRGGMYFGIAHLLGYPVDYTQSLYRFADFNAGWYASRNAAFQNAVSQLSGIPLALDGDLTVPGSYALGSTERAARALGKQLDLSDNAIRNQLLKGDRIEFDQTDLYRKVFAMADRQQGKPLPRAVLPGITLQSPKITRTLTTAWFAKRVDERRQRCMNRASALKS